MAASLQVWQRALGTAASGGRVLEVGELVASVVPIARSRSIVNAAAASHRATIGAELLDALAAGYLDAGGEVWGVWVHESNFASRTALERAGYVLDSRPAAMALELRDLAPHDTPENIEVERTTDLALLAEPLAAGYGFPTQFLTLGLPELLDHCEGWIARIDGIPAAGLLLVFHEQDALVQMVATAPDLRRRGAAGYALQTALVNARERGCTTSTLQSSALGESVYARLGYQRLGTYELWERRPD